ncbi:hypothetical protein FIE12Z_7682 [Fusarium flagelliforme]|uniref:Thioesterase domain-containing protein n=1 Tax=Fusarium flagelliforme TaxID=2675880 RepID=A0A395MLD3_9HYPO|nr:hypothetical protein FIE12Z_7682 [Fusarium flagelliforme]
MEEIYIPRDFINSIQNWDDRFKQLQDGNEWLEGIDKDLSDSDLVILRNAFLTDGHKFMSTVIEFLNAVKWQEFVAHICTRSVAHMPVLMHLLYRAGYLIGAALKRFGIGTAIPRVQVLRTSSSMRRSVLKDRVEGNWDGGQFAEIEHLSQLYETVKKEDHFVGLKIETSTDTDLLIEEVEAYMSYLDNLQAERMTFGCTIPLTVILTTVPNKTNFMYLSKRWATIGKNLCRLGLRVGADVPRQLSERNTPRYYIIPDLKAVINNEGPAVNVMLARLEKYQVQIQKQQQVITALQFRHLMEHLPLGVRDQWLAAASSKSDEVKRASRWDRMKEVEKWQEFWLEAVKQIFRAYKENRKGAWEGSEGREPSPFANLLKYHLSRTDDKDDDHDAIDLLANQTDVGERVKRLYNTLSQIIHQYSDANFEVNRLNFSPLDAQILASLVPKKAKEAKKKVPDGEDENWDPVDERSDIITWKKEFRRYIWEKVTPAATLTQANPSNKDTFDRVKELYNFLSTKFPSAELFPKNLSISTATFDEANFTSSITAKFTLAKKHINSCGMVHNAVLAALFDAIGRIALLATGRCVANGRVGLAVESSFLATAGDQIYVTGLMVRDEQDQILSTTVYMKTADDTMVASGSFQPGEVRETEEGEGYDNMI